MHKLWAPWGVWCAQLNLRARLLSFCFFVLQMEVDGAGWANKTLQRLRAPPRLSCAARQNPFSSYSAAAFGPSSLPLPISLSLGACRALIPAIRDTVSCVTLSGFGEAWWKYSWRVGGRSGDCDATQWNAISLAHGPVSLKKQTLVRGSGRLLFWVEKKTLFHGIGKRQWIELFPSVWGQS